MDVRQYLDATYLKTALQANLSEAENAKVSDDLVREAIAGNFKLAMVRPEYVKAARQLVADSNSAVLVGTVIDFPEGCSAIGAKLAQAEQAIQDGADELDFVINYEAFKQGDIDRVKEEVLAGSALVLSHHKVIKWIIEVAALNDLEIARLSALIKNVVFSNFKEDQYQHVFVKSSTGFYETTNGKPNGATVPAMIIMLENACPLPVKAAGGVRNYEEALEMIRLGVKRIGTSSAKAIAEGQGSGTDY